MFVYGLLLSESVFNITSVLYKELNTKSPPFPEGTTMWEGGRRSALGGEQGDDPLS